MKLLLPLAVIAICVISTFSQTTKFIGVAGDRAFFIDTSRIERVGNTVIFWGVHAAYKEVRGEIDIDYRNYETSQIRADCDKDTLLFLTTKGKKDGKEYEGKKNIGPISPPKTSAGYAVLNMVCRPEAGQPGGQTP